MKTFDPGHYYFLNNYSGEPRTPILEGEEDCEQPLVFMHRVGERYPGNEGNRYDGTNCQEVLRALIARSIYLNDQIPCAETSSAIFYLRRALFAFELRAARVKGAKLPENVSLEYIETFRHCRSCGHIYLHDFSKCGKQNKES